MPVVKSKGCVVRKCADTIVLSWASATTESSCFFSRSQIAMVPSVPTDAYAPLVEHTHHQFDQHL